jgi:hypothetical protein
MPDAETARLELIQRLEEQRDQRAKQVRSIVLPYKSRLVEVGLLDSSAVQQALQIELRELFPEAEAEVDLRTARIPHILRPL